MTRVGGIGGGAVPARRTGRAAGGFALAGAEEGPAAAATAAAGAVPALLALQEQAGGPPPVAERAARRGHQALAELRGLQLDLLRGRADPARLARLADLAASEETLADPMLAETLREIALRVRVELARLRVAPASAR